ncbi:MAG: hypothetical protein HY952_09605 [Elusimicrobia bacterium]|nr:hypothetical protein [Elusimicrobiota bacterium]
MIQASLEGSLKLINRSRKEAALYAAVSVAAALLYSLMCAALGAGPAYGPELEGAGHGLRRGFLAYLPGMVLSAWFLAGLAGRFTAHAGGRQADGLARCAKAWFLPVAVVEIGFAFLMWLAVFFLRFKPFIGAFIALAWLAAGVWLMVRLSLWLNAGFDEDISARRALERGWELTRGRAWTVLAVAGVPMAAASLLAWIFGTLSAPASVVYYVESALEGCAGVVSAGGLASLYFRIKAAGPLAEESAGGSFWGKQE